MENYQLVKDIRDGNHTVVRLMRHIVTKELVAVKYTPRGKVFLTPTHVAIVMEYAPGDLFDYVCGSGGLSEDESRYFFQQLITGVSFCHNMEICHRDLKLENTLLDGNRVKICDFGFSKSYLLHSRPNSMIGSPGYIAPEVLSCKEYDGKLADIWSSGVMLYIMVVGSLPFEDQEDPKNFRKTAKRIMAIQYKIPDNIHIYLKSVEILSRIFVANPSERITMREIKSHSWFLKNLPTELTEEAEALYCRRENPTTSLQSIEDMMEIVNKAKILPTSFTSHK